MLFFFILFWFFLAKSYLWPSMAWTPREDAADWKLENYFKEVTVDCGDKECTFWCFQCHQSNNPTYTDVVLWVQKVESFYIQ